jgi:hypothetical protein
VVRASSHRLCEERDTLVEAASRKAGGRAVDESVEFASSEYTCLTIVQHNGPMSTLRL